MTGIIQYWMLIASYKFHSERNIQHWMIIVDYKFRPVSDVKNIQQWMIMIVYKFNPGTDDKEHPIMEDNW